MNESKRPPDTLLVFGVLLITLAGLGMFIPLFRCPGCWPPYERAEADAVRNPSIEFQRIRR